jgi:hypothetical protein
MGGGNKKCPNAWQPCTLPRYVSKFMFSLMFSLMFSSMMSQRGQFAL